MYRVVHIMLNSRWSDNGISLGP